jgi:hypothetical protein
MGQSLVRDDSNFGSSPVQSVQPLRILPAALVAGQGDRSFVAIV